MQGVFPCSRKVRLHWGVIIQMNYALSGKWWDPECLKQQQYLFSSVCFLSESSLSFILQVLLFTSSLHQPELFFLLVPDRWHAEEALCCLSFCRWLQGCHSGWAYSWSGSLFSQRNMGTASEVSARYDIFTFNKCIVGGKRKSTQFLTVLKISMCFCKFIVASTKEWTEAMQDKDAQISHLYIFLLLFMSEFMNKLFYWVMTEAGKVRKLTLLFSNVLFCSMQPALQTWN